MQKGSNSFFFPPSTPNLLVLVLTPCAALVLVLGIIICCRMRRASLERSGGTSDLGAQAVVLLCRVAAGVPTLLPRTCPPTPAHPTLPSRSRPRGEQDLE